jgi:hypothetical protein
MSSTTTMPSAATAATPAANDRALYQLAAAAALLALTTLMIGGGGNGADEPDRDLHRRRSDRDRQQPVAVPGRRSGTRAGESVRHLHHPWLARCAGTSWPGPDRAGKRHGSHRRPPGHHGPPRADRSHPSRRSGHKRRRVRLAGSRKRAQRARHHHQHGRIPAGERVVHVFRPAHAARLQPAHWRGRDRGRRLHPPWPDPFSGATVHGGKRRVHRLVRRNQPPILARRLAGTDPRQH